VATSVTNESLFLPIAGAHLATSEIREFHFHPTAGVLLATSVTNESLFLPIAGAHLATSEIREFHFHPTAGVADLSFNLDNKKALIDNWLALFW